MEVLDALADSDALAILAASTAEPLSVRELAERCEIPVSTTYRKVDDLVDAGLLDELTRMGRGGRHVSEYVLGTERIVVSFSGLEAVELDSSSDAPERVGQRRLSIDGETVRVEPDGGEESSDPRHRRLQALFVEITGREEVVEEREPADSSRLVDSSTPSVSESGTTVVEDDGLSDATDDPDPSDGAD